jgi:hypothetical protein
VLVPFLSHLKLKTVTGFCPQGRLPALIGARSIRTALKSYYTIKLTVHNSNVINVWIIIYGGINENSISIYFKRASQTVHPFVAAAQLPEDHTR